MGMRITLQAGDSIDVGDSKIVNTTIGEVKITVTADEEVPITITRANNRMRLPAGAAFTVGDIDIKFDDENKSMGFFAIASDDFVARRKSARKADPGQLLSPERQQQQYLDKLKRN